MSGVMHLYYLHIYIHIHIISWNKYIYIFCDTIEIVLSIVTRCITVVRAQRILVICAADPISSQRALPGRRTVPNRDGVYIRESKEFISPEGNFYSGGRE